MLINYIRKQYANKEKGIFNSSPIGIVVALDKNKIGWSLLNPKDKWNKKIGLSIAIGRANKFTDEKDLFEQLESDKILLIHTRAYQKVKPIYDYVKQKAQIYFK